jgi:hypothetical protein
MKMISSLWLGAISLSGHERPPERWEDATIKRWEAAVQRAMWRDAAAQLMELLDGPGKIASYFNKSCNFPLLIKACADQIALKYS